jgi:hypothetical protein
MKKYVYYTRYKCKLLKKIEDYKVGTKLFAMLLPKRTGRNDWGENVWFLIPPENDRTLSNNAIEGEDFEIISDSEELPKKSKKS